MREILFKAKRWKDGKWVFGDLFQNQNDTIIHHYVNGSRVADSVDPRTVCQYTGLKDSYGNKVFEGDKIKIWDRKELNVVKYGKFNCGCCYDVYGFYFEGDEGGNQWRDNIINGRVVGNIHDKGE